MTKPIRQVWTFTSDSNPDQEYQTLQYTDGTTSCACKGWTRRVAPDGSRTCKHCRWIDLELADQHCTSTHNYNQNPQHQHHPQPHHAPSKVKTLKLGRRKFCV